MTTLGEICNFVQLNTIQLFKQHSISAIETDFVYVTKKKKSFLFLLLLEHLLNF